MQKFGDPKCQRTGVTTVEMAFAMSLLMLIIFGFFEVGHALMIDSVVENAAYEGARRGVIPGATESSAAAAAKDLAIRSSLRSVDVNVKVSEVSPGVRGITVTVKAPMNENAIFVGMFMENITIKKSVTMMLESDLRFRFPPSKQTFHAPTPRPRGRGNK